MVDITDNVCLNQKFEGNALTPMAETVTSACGFDEVETTTELTPMRGTCCASLISQWTNLETFLITDNNNKLEQELKSCKAQFDSIKEIYEELDAKRNKSSSIQLKEMRELVEIKVQEVQKLSRELEVKQTEINEQAQKIKNLEEKSWK
jgi:predicted RNase H-like nuclease (RuvC/YqgF family)